MADPQETEERLEWADSMADAMLRLPFPVTSAEPAFVSKEQYALAVGVAATLTPKQRSKQKFTLFMPSGQKLTFRGDALEPRFIYRVHLQASNLNPEPCAHKRPYATANALSSRRDPPHPPTDPAHGLMEKAARNTKSQSRAARRGPNAGQPGGPKGRGRKRARTKESSLSPNPAARF